MNLFEEKDLVYVCAPMVRYSKQPFRHLVRRYNCDLAYTPMIMADSFIKSIEARDSDFTTNKGLFSCILNLNEKATYAHCNSHRLNLAVCASYKVQYASIFWHTLMSYADGVGLNCGCPQRWAMAEGYGAQLISKPELINDMIKQTRQRLPQDFSCEIKIRIHSDIRKTVDLCQKAEHAGVSWITVHGRLPSQRNEPVNYDAIKTIKDSLQIPVVANGDIKNKEDAWDVVKKTGVNGVMAAQGMLNNPAMYAGYEVTPLQCVKDWVNIALSLGTPFVTFHHHLIFMLDKWLSNKGEKMLFNNLSSVAAVLDFLEDRYDISYDGFLIPNLNP
ncbi:tRNA-dihydrouridine(20a/20b) synthase [NAD(P)+]-like isoform X1 [Hydra vulgaris]|uniref:tRNA-dihydrouridine(20a/20b) synthase [NAD(P)+]-like isoform X1 n=1 Tax=Hydra vulgaris TaxID=6087 RepID=UPI001F5E49D4|nr:tRNA-dihydrouridine(20a/20b) synthase [NAD(P)+]-like isoform X1 [Hydra vulgaris]